MQYCKHTYIQMYIWLVQNKCSLSKNKSERGNTRYITPEMVALKKKITPEDGKKKNHP